MIAPILSYVAGILTLLILDGIMIWFVILPLFKKHVSSLINPDLNITAAVLFYLLYIAVAFFLVVSPAVKSQADIMQVIQNGALLGFGAYMTYEFTSMSIIKGWSWQMVAVDTLWGTVLTLCICVVMFVVYKYFL